MADGDVASLHSVCSYFLPSVEQLSHSSARRTPSKISYFFIGLPTLSLSRPQLPFLLVYSHVLLLRMWQHAATPPPPGLHVRSRSLPTVFMALHRPHALISIGKTGTSEIVLHNVLHNVLAFVRGRKRRISITEGGGQLAPECEALVFFAADMLKDH